MDALTVYRNAVARHAAHATGQDGRQSRLLTGQMRAAGLEHDIRDLPADATDFAILEDDFMLGVDGLGTLPLPG